MAAGSHFGCPKHLLPFQINTTIFIYVKFVYKMAAGGHFGCPKLTFDGMSGHFRSILNVFCCNFYKMAAGAHLDVRNSLSISFLAFSDRYPAVYIFFDKMAAVGHFGCPKFTFDHISGHFRSIRNVIVFFKF